jgi:hypothetical protein
LRIKIKGRGSELAKWLHLWIEGNAEQYPHKVETIRQLCGSIRQNLEIFSAEIAASPRLTQSSGNYPYLGGSTPPTSYTSSGHQAPRSLDTSPRRPEIPEIHALKG